MEYDQGSRITDRVELEAAVKPSFVECFTNAFILINAHVRAYINMLPNWDSVTPSARTHLLLYFYLLNISTYLSTYLGKFLYRTLTSEINLNLTANM